METVNYYNKLKIIIMIYNNNNNLDYMIEIIEVECYFAVLNFNTTIVFLVFDIFKIFHVIYRICSSF